jgi:hypothetical protein
VLRDAGVDVRYVDTGSARRALPALPALFGRHDLHVLHITRLARAAQLAPVFTLLPGRTALVAHSGSTATQLVLMGARRRRTILTALRAFDELWAVNREIRDLLPEALADRTTVVTPFDPAGLPASAQAARVPHMLVLSTNAGLAHYHARLGIEAARIVRATWPDAVLRILSYGRVGPELEELRRSVAAESWIDMPFDLSPAEVSSVLSRAGVFLRPTTWDGDSVIVREAVALGARVVASDSAPRPRGVELAPLDAAAFAEAVLHGGTASDGDGLVETTLATVALRSLAEGASDEPSG